jgi:hypothetical protein
MRQTEVTLAQGTRSMCDLTVNAAFRTMRSNGCRPNVRRYKVVGSGIAGRELTQNIDDRLSERPVYHF